MGTVAGCRMAMLFAALFHVGTASAEHDSNPPRPAGAVSTPREVVLRGRVVCLAEEMHRIHETDLPLEHPHLYGFRDDTGRYYTLLRTAFSEALFADDRVREMALFIKARLLPEMAILDVQRFFGIRGGKLEEIYYYCGVCSIRGPAPGPCPCCQDDLEFRIEPTDDPVPSTAKSGQ
jgi:hypothetical protein